LNKSNVEYKRIDRVHHNVDNEYDIVFDRCHPKIDGELQTYEELLMRYTKNGRTINNAPAFDEIDMMKAIVELYKSSVISDEAKEILRKGIIK
jgi:hypothetical protein